MGGAFVAGGAIGVVAAPAVTVAAANAVGFTATGVAAGSIAASAQRIFIFEEFCILLLLDMRSIARIRCWDGGS